MLTEVVKINNKLVIIAGPTAVGKTNISIMLAEKLKTEIVSADSMQIYKYMNIGSAKVTEEEKRGIKHHLVDIVDPKEEFSVSQYKSLAKEAIENCQERDITPLLVGGTGLYINSLICNLSFTESAKDDEYRMYLEMLSKDKGKEHVHDMLKPIDAISYENIHPNNLKRVIRALEVYKLTGKPFSSFREEELYHCPYDLFYYVLNMDRDSLYNRINKRVDLMLDEGLLKEVEELLDYGCDETMQSMKGIGYKELIEYLKGRRSYSDAVESIKQGSRNYAKRQLTWFRKDPRALFIDKDSYPNEEAIVAKILSDINKA